MLKRNFLMLALAVSLMPGTVLAKTSKLKNKEYRKEVIALVKAEQENIQIINSDEYISPAFKAMSIQLIEVDTYLISVELEKLKHKHATQEEVDKYVAQLSRDLENIDSLVTEVHKAYDEELSNEQPKS